MSEWRPISEAPKDGSTILLCVGQCEAGTGRYYRGKWIDVYPDEFADEDEFRNYLSNMEWHPTHWQPLPPPPQE